MFYQTLLLIVSILSLFALIVDKGTAAEQRHAEAHVHGVAEIDIVVEGKRVIVEFRTPTEGLMGFEHEARTDAERKKRDAAMKIINDRFNELVVLDKKNGCTWRTIKARIVRGEDHDTQDKQRGADNRKQSGEHSEVQATHTFECERSPVGTKATFGVSKFFPDIHEIKVQVLSEAKQSGVTIKKDKGEVEL
jgi:hypothetical protein